MPNVGFTAARSRLLAALAAAEKGEPVVQHDAREDASKNQLATGQLTLADVKRLVGRSSGLNYEEDDLHGDSRIRVHILKNVKEQNSSWYIKWYVVEPNVFFISVHD